MLCVDSIVSGMLLLNKTYTDMFKNSNYFKLEQYVGVYSKTYRNKNEIRV